VPDTETSLAQVEHQGISIVPRLPLTPNARDLMRDIWLGICCTWPRILASDGLGIRLLLHRWTAPYITLGSSSLGDLLLLETLPARAELRPVKSTQALRLVVNVTRKSQP
jgi:hypothetical protein